jgi:large subunit ribosomal protein L40e
MELGQIEGQTPEQTTTATATSTATAAPVDASVGSGQIFIKTLTGESISMDYRANLTISEIKNYIHSAQNITPDQQRLIYQGKQLEDGHTVADYEISANGTIHLVLRVKGGDFSEEMIDMVVQISKLVF